MKKVFTILLVLSFIASLSATLFSPSPISQAKSVYWLAAGNYGDGNHKFSLKYKKGYFIMKGKMAKGKTSAKAESKYNASKGTKYYRNKKVKAASSVRIHEIEDVERIYSLKQWLNESGSIHANIMNRFKIVNGKVKDVYFSA